MLDKDFLSEIFMPYFEGFQKSLRTILDNLNTFQTNSECFFLRKLKYCTNYLKSAYM